MGNRYRYYTATLAGERLKRCYDIAPPRVQQYLDAEIEHARGKVRASDTVLELGCGYGRVLPTVAQHAKLVVGIDTSLPSLTLAKETLGKFQNCLLLGMDACRLAFRDHTFDVIICIQNGLSAFHVDRRDLIEESIRVTKPGGCVLFSTYSDKFWNYRLEWFRLQSDAGLLGPIDEQKTRDGVIVCEDGFTATTVSPLQFHQLTLDLDAETRITEVDESSVFCEITPHYTGSR